MPGSRSAVTLVLDARPFAAGLGAAVAAPLLFSRWALAFAISERSGVRAGRAVQDALGLGTTRHSSGRLTAPLNSVVIQMLEMKASLLSRSPVRRESAALAATTLADEVTLGAVSGLSGIWIARSRSGVLPASPRVRPFAIRRRLEASAALLVYNDSAVRKQGRYNPSLQRTPYGAAELARYAAG